MTTRQRAVNRLTRHYLTIGFYLFVATWIVVGVVVVSFVWGMSLIRHVTGQ